MSSVSNIQFSNPIPSDLAKKLGRNGIVEILAIMWLGYDDLRADGIVSIRMKEDEITEAWFIRLCKRWYAENRASRINLAPVTQHGDDTKAFPKGSPPTIDFCFREWRTSNSYFGAECKNLYHHDSKHIQRYVDTGVKHYISGRYGSGSTTSTMIGYVLSGKAVEIADELRDTIGVIKPLLNLSRDITSKDAQYKSQHLRIPDKEIIMLYHLLFDFT